MSLKQVFQPIFLLTLMGLTACPSLTPNPNQSNTTTRRPDVLRVQAVMSTIYASPSGSGGSCSSGSPCSLVGARDRVRGMNGSMSGDIVVWVSDGTYNLTSSLALNGQDSGSNGYNVIWKASGNNAVLSGGQNIAGWAMFDSAKNIYRANVGTSLNTRQVFVNGTRATRARGAQNPGGWTKTSTGYTAPDSTMASWGNKSNIEIVNYIAWKSFRCPVGSISGSNVTIQNPCWDNAQLMAPGFSMNGVTWVENALELLDAEGEWYLDRSAGFMYYKPQAGENISSANIVAAKTETILEIAGTLAAPAHHIQFVGLNFRHNTWLSPSTAEGYAVVQAGWHHTGPGRTGFTNNDMTRTPGAVSVTNANNLRFERNQFKQTGSVALDFLSGNQNSAIVGNTFDETSSSAIQIGGTTQVTLNEIAADPRNRVSDMVVSNNTIARVGEEFHDAVGILMGYVSSSTIAHNKLSNLPYTGISVGWGWGGLPSYPTEKNVITYNQITDTMKTLVDGGAIYTLSQQPGSIIKNNFIQNGAEGIYLDNGTQGYTATNNVLLGLTSYWAHVQYFSPNASNNALENNYTDTNTTTLDPNNVVQNNTLVSSGSLPAAAQAIVNCAGVEPAYGGSTTCAGDLKAQWLMENNSSDASGNGNYGTLNGGASYSPDARQGNSSLSLNGTTGYLATSGNLTAATDNVSLTAWVKWAGATSGNQFIVYNGNSAADGYGLFINPNNHLVILVGGKAFVTSTTTPATGVWTHVAAVRESGTWKLYVAGSAVPLSGGVTTAPNTPSERTTVGSSNTGVENFSGLIDDARVYDKALTATDIAVLAPPAAPTAPAGGNLKAQWRMENNTNDSTSNASNGTLNGGASYSTDAREGSASLRINGSSGYFAAPNNITTATNNISVATWVKWSGPTSGNQFIFYNGNSGGNGYGLFMSANNRLTLLIGGVAFINSTTTLTPETWTHVAAVRDSGTWKLYVDGNSVALTGATGSAPNGPGERMTIGSSNSGGENFYGLIDDTRVYDKALSASEVSGLLSNTNTLEWSATGSSVYHQIGRVDGDGWSANTAQDNSSFLIYGPYTTQISVGSNIATWNMMVDNNTADNSSVVQLEVVDASAGGIILASRNVTRQEWTSTMTYQPFTVPFNLAAASAGHQIELRVYWMRSSYVRVRNITVTQ